MIPFILCARKGLAKSLCVQVMFTAGVEQYSPYSTCSYFVDSVKATTVQPVFIVFITASYLDKSHKLHCMQRSAFICLSLAGILFYCLDLISETLYSGQREAEGGKKSSALD